MTVTRWLVALVALIALAFIAIGIYGNARWKRLTLDLEARLQAARLTPTPVRYDETELTGLPPVVQRFFRVALTPGTPLVAAMTVTHAGTFNVSERAERWVPFSSTQRVVTRQPGFVWNARASIAPGVAVNVHDAYVAGEGTLRPALLGAFDLALLRDTAAMAQGELMRFFAEAAWYPTALLPSQGVQWEALDERSARATLRDGAIAVTLTFSFRPDGMIDTCRAEARGRTVNGIVIPTPWEGRWSDYREHDGMRIPMTGEVAWLLPEGRKPYWRGTITTVQIERAAGAAP